MANELTFNQTAAILNALNTQATGQAAIAPTDTASFVAAGTTLLKTGYEQVYRAISAVLGRTIFSVRPYYAKLRGMEVSDTMFRLHTRKLQVADNELENNKAVEWPVHYDDTEDPISGNDESVDMQQIKKANVLQTNFYGTNTFADHYTLFDEQLEIAFTSPDELAMFWTMILQNVSDRFEQSRENCARAILSNAIGALSALNESGRIIHLLTEYNTRTGKSLTTTTVYDPANYPDFMRFVFGRVAALSSLMTERSSLFQSIVNSKYINRHTPVEKQRLYLFAPEEMQMRSQVLSTTFHDEFLRMADHEMVNFWQSIQTPGRVSVTPGYIAANGNATTGSAQVVNNVFGILMDEEAGGYTRLRSSIKPAPYNAAGDYQNFWLKEYNKMYMDNTEKMVLLLLD